MDPRLREYLRELTEKEIKDLRAKYKKHVKSTRDGFLNTRIKQMFLHITNWESKISDREIYDYFYEIRERTKSAIIDMQILCDVLSEKQLQTIFGTKEYKPKAEDLYPIMEVLNSLITERYYKGSKKKLEKIQKEREWRKLILEDVTARGLLWYYNSGILQTSLNRRLIQDSMETLQILSSGVVKLSPDSVNGAFST